MKIILISSGVIETPPVGYGGLEQVVADIAICLDNLGHEVTVICTDESQIGAYGSIKPLYCGKKDPNAHAWEEQAYNKYKDILHEFDIIHDHSWKKYSYLSKIANPKLNIISTLHGMCMPGSPYGSPPPVIHPNFTGLSKNHAMCISGALGINTRYAYNGIDLDKYPYQKEKEDKFLFLSRINAYKAPHVFADIINKNGFWGDIVGDDTLVEDPNYVERIIQMCNENPKLTYWGGVHRQRAAEFFRNAKALIVPLLPPWIEPFNLTIIESMASGTPVIALRNGAIPELIEHGKNGFIANTPDELSQYLYQINNINPEDCRQKAELFSKENMTKMYLDLYQEILEKGGW